MCEEVVAMRWILFVKVLKICDWVFCELDPSEH